MHNASLSSSPELKPRAQVRTHTYILRLIYMHTWSLFFRIHRATIPSSPPLRSVGTSCPAFAKAFQSGKTYFGSSCLLRNKKQHISAKYGFWCLNWPFSHAAWEIGTVFSRYSHKDNDSRDVNAFAVEPDLSCSNLSLCQQICQNIGSLP